MKYKTAFRLALRAIGVLLVFHHLPSLLAASAATVSDWFIDSSLIAAIPFSFYLRELLNSGCAVLAGLYLLFGGRWIVNHVIPSNKPYCPECGYELTGLSPGAVCPECGVQARVHEPADQRGPGPA